MESGKKLGTVVLNLVDGREKLFSLPPEKAVVAAFEVFDTGGCPIGCFLNPPAHPHFKEYLLGYSCGDWIAYKDSRMLR